MEKEIKKYQKYVQNFREKYIPNRYNQIELMNFLLNDEIDHYMSISNRSDGKSFNYLHFILNFCIDYEIGFTLLCRKFFVRDAYMKLIHKIIDTSPILKQNDFAFFKEQHYVTLLYKDRDLGIISDLNQATDLKYQSNFIEDFPIMIYDEFLALDGDYLSDEWDRLKTIYASINRKEEIPYIKFPKIIYLGNAVNFSSPILAELDIFNILEKHPINQAKQYENICLEMRKNESANESRNLRAFKEKNDEMTNAEFKVNSHSIATKKQRYDINANPRYIFVKLDHEYLKITYNFDTKKSILSVVSYAKDYDFNLRIKDNKKSSIFLKESFFDVDHYIKYNKGVFLFDNQYSKDFILDSFNGLIDLKIHKIIGQYEIVNNDTKFEIKEKTYNENFIENSKKSIFRKFFGV